MGILDIFRRKPVETRASGGDYTAQIISARQSFIAGASGLGELTATVQSAVSLWENGLSIADVTGTDLLTRRTLALAARSLALRGEAAFLIGDAGLVPVSDWDLRTRDGRPSAYRVSIPEAGGARAETVLAAEVLHFRIGSDPAAPWSGVAPLRRAQLTAGLLNAVEAALAETFETAPIGSQIVPFPETPQVDLETMARGFRGARGRVLIRESVHVAAAGGPAPIQDWRPNDLSPDLQKTMVTQTLAAAREAIGLAFGVLPGMIGGSATGPMVREGQRHLACWVLAPIAAMIGEEASDKLGTTVSLDVLRPLQAWDAGGRARALSTIVSALAEATAAGVDASEALKLVGWEGEA